MRPVDGDEGIQSRTCGCWAASATGRYRRDALLSAATRTASGQIPFGAMDPQILPLFGHALAKSVFLRSD